MATRPGKTAYDKARYHLVRAKKIASAQKWYRENKETKQEYDIKRRPVKNTKRREQYAKDPESFLAPMRGPTGTTRRGQLKQYGLTVETFEALFALQGRRCACCRRTELKGNKGWCVDHDHATGKVRGILCGLCNTGIGALGDNAIGIENARAYLNPGMKQIEEHY